MKNNHWFFQLVTQIQSGKQLPTIENIELGIRVQEPQVSDRRLSTTINMLPPLYSVYVCLYVGALIYHVMLWTMNSSQIAYGNNRRPKKKMRRHDIMAKHLAKKKLM